MAQNAYELYGNVGLLEISDITHQDFTVKDNQYANIVKDGNGCLVEFTIYDHLLNGSTFIASENGILVGPQGLKINNNSSARRIIIQSLGDEWINLLGTTTIYGNPAELIFITPYKIYCNGCNFSNFSILSFCTIPNSSPLASYLLQNDPSSYCTSSGGANEIYIGSKGLSSPAATLYSYSGILKTAGPIIANSISMKANSDITFNVNGLIDDHSKIFSNNQLTIYTAGNVILHNNARIESKSIISLTVGYHITFHSNSAIKSETEVMINGIGNLLYFHNDFGQTGMLITAKKVTLTNFGNDKLIQTAENIKIEASNSISVQSYRFVNKGLTAANEHVQIDGIVENYGTINCKKILNINANYMYLFSYSRIEALQQLNVITNALTIYDNTVFYSYGSLILEASNHQLLQLVELNSSTLFGSSGDAVIRANIFRNQMEMEVKKHEHTRFTNTCNKGKWSITAVCYKDELISNKGHSTVRIGGELYFNGYSIINIHSYFEVGKNINFEHKTTIENLSACLFEGAQLFPSGIEGTRFFGDAAASLRGAWGHTRLQDRCFGLENGEQHSGEIKRSFYNLPSTFFARGGTNNNFAGIVSIATEAAGTWNVPQLNPSFKLIESNIVTSVPVISYQHNPATLANALATNREVKPEDQVYSTSQTAQVPSGNPNLEVTQGNSAADKPLVDYAHKPLLSCDYGTAELLTALGVDKSRYPQIFASADIEKTLIEHGMFQLTGLGTIYEFTEVKDLFLQINNGKDVSDTSVDKACTQLKWLLVNGAKVKDQYWLEVGKSIEYSRIASIDVPFAWPVSKEISGYGPKLLLELYLPKAMINRMPAWYGPALLLGNLNADIPGNFISTGFTYVNDGAVLKAANIGLSGAFIVKNGAASLTADGNYVNVGGNVQTFNGAFSVQAENIYELIAFDNSNSNPNSAKRAIYSVNGNGYYLADNNIVQQATMIYVSGDFSMYAGNDIIQHSGFRERIVHEESGKKLHIIERTVDHYGLVLLVEGDIEIDAGHDFKASGAKYSAGGDVNIEAVNSATLESDTEYARNTYEASKKRPLSKSSVTMKWTTSTTAQLEISAPNGKIYVSAKECVLEGAMLNGKPVFKCGKLIDKPHEVVNTLQVTTSKSGLLRPQLPLYDMLSSDKPLEHILDNSILGAFKQLFEMSGPTDLLPAMNLVAQLPSVKADFNALQSMGANVPLAILGAIMSRYFSATISFGKQKTTTNRTTTYAIPTSVQGEYCEFTGPDGASGEYAYFSGNYECGDSLYIRFDKVKVTGSQNSVTQEHTASSTSYDQSISLSGLSAGISASDSTSQYEQVVNNPGTMHAKQIIIIADDRLDIKGAVINGKEIKVEAEVLTIEQVLDTVRSEYNSDGISAGITVTWSGAVVPYGSFNHGDGVKQSQVVRFLSSISGESVDVTAKHLIYNIATITASKELKVTADNIAYTPMPEGENVDQETRIMMAFSVGSDGKLRGSVAGSHRDGDFVVSGGYFSSFFEGLEIIKSWGDVINPPPNQKQIELQQKLQGLTDQLIDKQLELELKKVSEEDKPKLIELTKEIKAIKNGVIIVRPLPPLEGSNVLSGTDAEQSNAKAIAHAIAAAVNKYAIFSEKHPVLAKHGLTMLNVAAQTLLGGVVGLVNSVKSELVAYGIDKTTGEYTTAALDWMITEASIVTKNKYPELTYQEAKTLAAATLIGTGMFVAGSIAIKHIFKEIHELHFPYFLRHGDDFAYAGMGGHKKSWFDADANDNVLYRDRTDLPDTVQKVGPNYPINADKAGKVYHFDDLPDTTKAKYPELAEKYPHGVRYDEYGFPDFSPYALHTVKINKFVKYNDDFASANKLVGLRTEPKGYTWHHHQDGKTMQLVPRDLHNAFKHTGGMSTTKHGANNK